jgi:hypothetical protein
VTAARISSSDSPVCISQRSGSVCLRPRFCSCSHAISGSK